MKRAVTTEILDHLDPADPRAVQSRRDLRVLDAFLGNSRWILRGLQQHGAGRGTAVELGAGEGKLCRRIHRAFPGREVIGLDRFGRPMDLPAPIRWVSGDFLETLPGVDADTCCGSLILHHFEAADLRRLGRELRRFSHLFFSEPYRGQLPLRLSKLALPFAGEVTRHDMPASIRAGFRRDELAALLELPAAEWSIREQVTLRGCLRFAAIKK